MTNTFFMYKPDINDEYGFTLHEMNIPAGTHYPLHWHDFLEFEIIVSGKAEHTYNAETYIACPGTAYLMYYYDFHELTALTDIKLYSIHFNKQVLAPEISRFLDNNKFYCHFNDEETKKIIQRILELDAEANLKLPFGKQIIQNILSEIVISMIRKSTTSNVKMVPLPIQQATAFLNSHFREEITLEMLASHLGLTPNYLGHLFKTQLGCNFNNYLNTLRLKYACSLLLSSKIPIKEIAYMSGYRSVEYFMYLFKKRMLISPGEYRRQFQSQE